MITSSNMHKAHIAAHAAQVSSPTREPSFAAQKFMLDVFLAMPGLRATGDALPLLFRNAASAPRPWEARPDSSAPGP